MMDASKAVGYTSAVIMVTAGIIVLFGLFMPPYLPKQVRLAFGIVLALWGIYRFVTTQIKSSRYRDIEK